MEVHGCQDESPRKRGQVKCDSVQVAAELEVAGAKRLADYKTLEMLRKLTAELALVAAATGAGTRGYMVGRSHGS